MVLFGQPVEKLLMKMCKNWLKNWRLKAKNK